MNRPLLLIPADDPAPAACVPGRDGIPNSFLGHLMCGDWATSAPSTAWTFACTHWPLLLAAAVLVVALAIGWRLLRRRTWRNHAAQVCHARRRRVM